jgi:hypothetical protein
VGDNCFKDNDGADNNTKQCRGLNTCDELCSQLGESMNWNDSH